MEGREFLTHGAASIEKRIFGGIRSRFSEVSRQNAFEYVVEDRHTIQNQGVFECRQKCRHYGQGIYLHKRVIGYRYDKILISSALRTARQDF